MNLVKAYGINIKYNGALSFERLATFDSYNIACEAYQMILCSQEAEYAIIELERITVLENGDYEYETIIRSREEKEEEKNYERI